PLEPPSPFKWRMIRQRSRAVNGSTGALELFLRAPHQPHIPTGRPTAPRSGDTKESPMRSTMRRPLLAVTIMLVLGLSALAVGGCGSDETTATDSTDTAEQTAMSSDTEGVEVGGAMMTPDRDIVANAADAS